MSSEKVVGNMNSVLGVPKGKGVSYSKRKLEVLKAAAKLFNQRGFNNATMDDIAATLNVTKPALYYYAKGKDEILFEIGSIALGEALLLLENISMEKKSAAENLHLFFVAWTESICQEFGRCMVLAKPELLEPESQKKSKQSRRNIHHHVEKLIQTGINEGSISPCKPKLMSLALFDLFNGITYWYREDGPMNPTEIANQYWRNFGQGFLSKS